jgi:carbon storage regulator CsrA
VLVLSRKIEESIIIGDNIKIKIVGFDRGLVKLGIEAPKEISILREELLDEVKRSNIEASKQDSSESIGLLSRLFEKK